MKAAERRAQVEALLGPELTAKHQVSVDYGVRARLSPKSIEKTIRSFEDEVKLPATLDGLRKALDDLGAPGDSKLEITIDGEACNYRGRLSLVSWYVDETGQAFLCIDIEEGEVL